MSALPAFLRHDEADCDSEWVDDPTHASGKKLLAYPRVPDGAGSWAVDHAGLTRALIYVCPCGCRSIGALTIYVEGETKPDPERSWLWNGDEVRPTLTPSIHASRRCGWHGYLTDGQWRLA